MAEILFRSMCVCVCVCAQRPVNQTSLQESLADAKVSARQQCVYEGLWRRNLQQINDMRFPIDG